MHRIYKRKQFVIYQNKEGYIVQNILMKDFAHTHINNYKTAQLLVNLSLHKRVPHHLSDYLLVSLQRINNDAEYVRKVTETLENKHKKEMYYNVNKGVRNG